MKSLVLENMGTWLKKYDMPPTDKKSLELQENFEGKYRQWFQDTIQDANEVAELVKTIILSDKPSLRYQTNDKFHPDELQAKLADPTGNVLMELVKKKYLDKE